MFPKLNLALNPINDIERGEANERIVSWTMTGSDPSFLLDGGGTYAPGIYVLWIETPHGTNALYHPVLYVDSGEDFNEPEAIRLRFGGDTLSSAIFELPKGALRLRLDPSIQPGELVIGQVSISKVPRRYYQLRQIMHAGKTRVKSADDLKWAIRSAYRILRTRGWKGLRQSIRRQIDADGGALSYDNSDARPVITFDGRRYNLSSNTPPQYVYFAPRPPRDLKHYLASPAGGIRFSIIVPVYNTPAAVLVQAIDSVRSQWHENWELILADDASTSAETKKILGSLKDGRIRVLRSEVNQRISGASNAGLRAASGDYVVLLDHDDELTPDCLYELAKRAQQTDADYIYSDEDKISPEGLFVEPHFKPDWSPDTMMNTMYVCHVSCIRRSLIEEVGGFRSDYDGCQDWDLILRVTEKTDKIEHIAKILYHWRIISGSVAMDIAEKDYVQKASIGAREDAIRRRAVEGSLAAVPRVRGYHRAVYRSEDARLSAVIPSRDNERFLRQCIESLMVDDAADRPEVVVVDNGSVDTTTLDYLQKLRSEGVNVVRHDAAFNFSELCNIGARASTGNVITFLNDDIEVRQKHSFADLAGYARLKHVGAVGAKLLYPQGNIQHNGVVNLENGPIHSFIERSGDEIGYFGRCVFDYNWLLVTGACLTIEKDKFFDVGLFDEAFPIAYNDVDLCLRLHEAGLHNVLCTNVEMIHYESMSRGLDAKAEAKLARLMGEKDRLFLKHPRFFECDPLYNPNLHPNGINFELAL